MMHMKSRGFLIFAALVTHFLSLTSLPRSTSAQRVLLEARPATSEVLPGAQADGLSGRVVPITPIDPGMFNPRYRISAADVREYCANAAGGGSLRDAVKRNAERQLGGGLSFGSMVRERATADDVTQLVMLKIWENCRLILGNKDAEMGGYIQRMLQNQITNEARAGLRQKKVISAQIAADAPPALSVEDPEQSPTIRVDMKDLLATLIAQLTPTERSVLEGLIMDLDVDAIAESLKIKRGTVLDHRTSIRKKYQGLLLRNSAAK
jgi:RNA polymerase sigma factor (sigma-70 family)